MDRLRLVLHTTPLVAMLAIGLFAVLEASPSRVAEDAATAHIAAFSPWPAPATESVPHHSELVPRHPLYVPAQLRDQAAARSEAVVALPGCIESCEPTATPTPSPTPEPVQTPTAPPAYEEVASAASAATAPPPAPVVATTAGCPELIASALGVQGCMISFCESHWNSNATGSAGERGWFQIHPRWHADSTYDPAGNVASAVRISSGGSDWSAWTTRGVLAAGYCPNGERYPA